MALRLITFAQAIKHATTRCDRLSGLLGNGFSIDYSPALFAYDSLAEEARLERLSVDKHELFDGVGSTDFETVVERLRTATKLTVLYGDHKKLARQQTQVMVMVVRSGEMATVPKFGSFIAPSCIRFSYSMTSLSIGSAASRVARRRARGVGRGAHVTSVSKNALRRAENSSGICVFHS